MGEVKTKKWEACNEDKPLEKYKIVDSDVRTDKIILQVVNKHDTYDRKTQSHPSLSS
jgi:hypothetical protein